jgi:hypothetical protein
MEERTLGSNTMKDPKDISGARNHCTTCICIRLTSLDCLLQFFAYFPYFEKVKGGL